MPGIEYLGDKVNTTRENLNTINKDIQDYISSINLKVGPFNKPLIDVVDFSEQAICNMEGNNFSLIEGFFAYQPNKPIGLRASTGNLFTTSPSMGLYGKSWAFTISATGGSIPNALVTQNMYNFLPNKVEAKWVYKF